MSDDEKINIFRLVPETRDFSSIMKDAASKIKIARDSFIEAGFSEEESLELVKSIFNGE